MRNNDQPRVPWMDCTHVDFDAFRANAERKIDTTAVRVFEDIDGYQLIEQGFSDGTTVLMHEAQYNAITLAVARDPQLQAMILFLAGEGSRPAPTSTEEKTA